MKKQERGYGLFANLVRIMTVFVLVSTSVISNAQFTIIPTGTTSTIAEIHKRGNFVLLNAQDTFIAKCYDGCDSIVMLNDPGTYPAPDYLRTNVNLVDTNNIYMSVHEEFPHHGVIFRSDDGGYSWHEIYDTVDVLFSQFIMFDTLSGAVISTLSKTFRTYNGGNSWSYFNNGPVACTAVYRINDSSAVRGSLDNVSITLNNGQSWIGKPADESPRALYAIEPDTFYSISAGSSGRYFSYCDNWTGSSWEEHHIYGFEPYGLIARNSNEVYVVGKIISSGHAGILKTTNLGESWWRYDTQIPGAFSDIELLDDSTALISGTNGLLIKWNTNSPMVYLGIDEIESGANLSLQVYPNPTETCQSLTLNSMENASGIIELHDIGGRYIRTVFSGQISIGNNSFESCLEDLDSGVYFYQVTLENGEHLISKTIKF